MLQNWNVETFLTVQCWDSVHELQRLWVWSLIGELTSHSAQQGQKLKKIIKVRVQCYSTSSPTLICVILDHVKEELRETEQQKWKTFAKFKLYSTYNPKLLSTQCLIYHGEILFLYSIKLTYIGNISDYYLVWHKS